MLQTQNNVCLEPLKHEVMQEHVVGFRNNWEVMQHYCVESEMLAYL